MKCKLDARTVAALTALPEDRSEQFYWCDQLDRFGLRLRRGADGRVIRTYVAQYRRREGGTRRMNVGSADTLKPEQARTAARELLARADLGGDPQGDRSERRDKDKLSFRSVAAEYIEIKRGDVRPSTLRNVSRYLVRGSYFKALMGMPVDRITRKDVAAQLVRIARENGKSVAGEARSALSAFFAWTVAMAMSEVNPVIDTPQQKSAPARTRTLSDQELARIWGAADGNDEFSPIVRLLILLPCRRSEIGSAEWNQFDFDACTFTVPASKAKNGQAVKYVLTDMMLEVIRSIPRRERRDLLFGRKNPTGFLAWDRAKKALDEKLKITEPWNLHDLRRTLATRLSDLGTPPHVIAELLNHKTHKAGVAGVYNHSRYEREVKQALNMWSDHIRSLVTGGERKVVALQTK
jgi:integrase